MNTNIVTLLGLDLVSPFNFRAQMRTGNHAFKALHRHFLYLLNFMYEKEEILKENSP
jgi:hypothetical protein